jgi:predicted XRE-type DNA-binding protein
MLTISAMLLAVIDSGMTQTQIAEHLGTSQPTIHRLLKKNCRADYDIGKHIEKLYAARVVCHV